MDDRIDDLLSEIAEYLHQEQEIYGSLPFPVPGSKKSEPALTSEVKSETKTVDSNSGKSESIPDNQGTSETKSVDRESGNSESATDSRRRIESETEESKSGKNDSVLVNEETTKSKPEESKLRESDPFAGENRLDQATTLEELKQICEESNDLKTDLAGTNMVFGVGNPNADLMIIGEAPGEQEDRQGEPFVGAAGQLLNKILAAIQFERNEVYIANILKHRPPGNRNPNPDERLRSLPYLLKQVDLIQPKLILCLGRISATTLLNKDDSLRNLRGQFYPYRNCLLTVTYHPAALLRNPQWKRPTWEDVQKVRTKYDELTKS